MDTSYTYRHFHNPSVGIFNIVARFCTSAHTTGYFVCVADNAPRVANNAARVANNAQRVANNAQRVADNAARVADSAARVADNASFCFAYKSIYMKNGSFEF